MTAAFDHLGVRERLDSRGGFRTSPEGFITTYATTQALEALAQLRQSLNEESTRQGYST